jgi:hypothetical protein
VEVVGTFQAPDGGRGLFTGAYRLERLVDEHGQLAAAGVFTGELHAANGSHVGTGSRRLTCAAVVGEDAVAYDLCLGPVDVNLLGFMVTVGEFNISMRRDLVPSSSVRSGPAHSRRQARAER